MSPKLKKAAINGDIAGVWRIMDGAGLSKMTVKDAGNLYKAMRESPEMTQTQAKFLFGVMFARFFKGNRWNDIVAVHSERTDASEIRKGVALHNFIRQLYERE